MNVTKKMFTLLVWMVSLSVAQAQIEFGVRGGVSLTSGHTDISASKSSVGALNISTPVIKNESNGIGVGLIAGVYARKDITRSGLFVEAGVGYTSFLLKQISKEVKLDYETTTVLPTSQLPFPVNLPTDKLKLDLKGNINLNEATTGSTLKGIDFNVGLGKHFFDKKFRIYGGFNMLIVTQAEKESKYTGISASTNNVVVNGLTTEQLVGSGVLTNQQVAGVKQMLGKSVDSKAKAGLSKIPNQDLKKESASQVKNTIIGLDLGIGGTIPNTGIGVDLRYHVPVFTGVLKHSEGGGFLGITMLTLSYSILNPKQEQ